MEQKNRRILVAMRRHHAPNLVILSRSSDPPIARLRRDDDIAEAKEKSPVDLGGSAGANKRELRGMSARSSVNLAKVLSSLDWAKNGQCIHVSPTYWKTWPRTKAELGRAKQAITMAVSRHVECGLWRLEYQRRETDAEKLERIRARRARVKGQGSLFVPHWHMLLWLGNRSLEEVSSWLYKWWADYSGNRHEHALKITSGDQARGAWYLAMHAAKRAQSPPFAVGRWWGYINRDVFLSAQDIHDEGTIQERERIWWARLYRRCTHCKTRNSAGFSWFLPRDVQRKVVNWVEARVELERFERNKPKNPF